jgi:hypothetical protein
MKNRRPRLARTVMMEKQHMFRTALVQIAAFTLVFSATAFAGDDGACKKFKVSFSSPQKTTLDGIFHGGKQIGAIVHPENHAESNLLDICIDTSHAGEIEKNTVCYISDNSMIVYNVWASGEDLSENSTLPGFSNKLSLFWHEIRLLFRSITG